MLKSSVLSEKERIKAWHLTWYTHVKDSDRADASQKVLSYLEKIITRLKVTELKAESSLNMHIKIQSLFVSWVQDEWERASYLPKKCPESPFSQGLKLAKKLIKHDDNKNDSIFVRGMLDKIAFIMACVIVENLMDSVSSPAIGYLADVLDKINSHNNRWMQDFQKIIDCIAFDKNQLIDVEASSNKEQLDAALIAVEQLYHAKKAELGRILSILKPETIKLLNQNKSMTNQWGDKLNPFFKMDYKIMLGHALELKEFYKETHYVFIHGQRQKLWIYLKFAKFLHEKCFPEKGLSLFKILKLGGEQGQGKSATTYCQESFRDDDISIMQKLLSVDGYLFNTNPGESASYFCQMNNNVWKDDLKPLLGSFIDNNLHLDLKRYADIVEQVDKISEEFSMLSDTGNLVVLCIPKNKSHDRFYEAHPGGEACAKNSNFHQQRLEHLQNDHQVESCAWMKRMYDVSAVSQYRIVVNNMNPAEGDRIFMLSPISQISRNYYKAQLRLLTQQLYEIWQTSDPTTLSNSSIVCIPK